MRSNCLQRERSWRPPPKPAAPWMDFDEVKQRNKANTAVAVKPEPATLMPKVVLYDATTGVPTNAQDVRAAQDQSTNIAAVPWKQWLGGRAAQTLPEKATHMAAILMVLYSLHTRGRIEMAPIDVNIGLTKHRKVVTASEDLPAGALALAPCVPKTSSVLDKSVHPRRVPIVVTERSAVADGEPELRKSTKGSLEPKAGRILRASRIQNARREQGATRHSSRASCSCMGVQRRRNDAPFLGC